MLSEKEIDELLRAPAWNFGFGVVVGVIGTAVSLLGVVWVLNYI